MSPSLLQSQLIKAIREGDNLTIEHLTRIKRVNPNFETPKGYSPIHLAASKNCKIQTLNLLLDAGADPNRKGFHSPLEKLISYKNLEAVRLLVKKGANVNCYLDERKTTPLHASIKHEAFAITKFLLESKALVNTRNYHGMTPLHNLATMSSAHANVFDAFVDAGVDMNCGNFDGYTPLHMAVCGGHINNVVLLLERGADPLAATADGDTTLHLACCHGQLAIIQLLMKIGVPIESQNKMKLTPLHQAVDSEKTLSVFYLVKAGANVNALDITGKRPIYSAALRQDLQCLNILLKAGSKVSHELCRAKCLKDEAVVTDDSKPLGAVMEQLSLCPQSLKEISLLNIRSMLAPHVQTQAYSDLPISKALQKELALESLTLDEVL